MGFIPPISRLAASKMSQSTSRIAFFSFFYLFDVSVACSREMRTTSILVFEIPS